MPEELLAISAGCVAIAAGCKATPATYDEHHRQVLRSLRARMTNEHSKNAGVKYMDMH